MRWFSRKVKIVEAYMFDGVIESIVLLKLHPSYNDKRWGYCLDMVYNKQDQEFLCCRKSNDFYFDHYAFIKYDDVIQTSETWNLLNMWPPYLDHVANYFYMNKDGYEGIIVSLGDYEEFYLYHFRCEADALASVKKVSLSSAAISLVKDTEANQRSISLERE